MSGQHQPVISYTGRAEKEDHSFLTSLMHMYVATEVRDHLLDFFLIVVIYCCKICSVTISDMEYRDKLVAVESSVKCWL